MACMMRRAAKMSMGGAPRAASMLQCSIMLPIIAARLPACPAHIRLINIGICIFLRPIAKMLHRSMMQTRSAREIMHKPAIHPDVVRRANERRGRLRVFDSLISRRCAHIVVDLQNGFMAPGPGRRDRHRTRDRAQRQPDQRGAARGRRARRLHPEHVRRGRRRDVVDLLRAFLQPGAPAAHDRDLQPRRLRPRDLAGARRPAAGPQGAEASLRRLRAGLVGPARDPAGARASTR